MKDESESKLKRTQEREKWHEFQIIIKGYRALGFDYIIGSQSQQKICFGSAMEREVLPLSGSAQSSLMRRILYKPVMIENGEEQLVCKHRKLSRAKNKNKRKHKKLPERENKDLLTNAVPRYQYKGEVCLRSRDNENFRKNIKPFNIGEPKRRLFGKIADLPGPGTYNTPKFHCYQYDGTFGSIRKIIPAVRTICKAVHDERCSSCDKILNGDYWLKDEKDNCMAYCLLCWTKENQLAQQIRSKVKRMHRLRDLKEFQMVRTCQYYHDHKGTTARIEKLDRNIVRKKIQYENYLLSFK